MMNGKTIVSELVDGAQYEKGLKNPHFVTNPTDKRYCRARRPVYVLLVENHKLKTIRQIYKGF